MRYRVIAISLYDNDLEDLDRKVAALKVRYARASRSELIRYALRQIEPDDVSIEQLVTAAVMSLSQHDPSGKHPVKPSKKKGGGSQ